MDARGCKKIFVVIKSRWFDALFIGVVSSLLLPHAFVTCKILEKSMFIDYAFADAPKSGQSGVMAFLPMIAFMVILYFLLIRPQQKKQKAHQALIASIKPGDKVMTSSGLLATVTKVINDNEVILEVSDGVQCKFIKSAIVTVITNDQNNKTTNQNQG